MGNCNSQTPCGDIYAPPSRANCSIFAIIELVIMGVVAVICFIELCDYLSSKSLDTLNTLILIDDILIVVALCYLVYGFFCAFGQNAIRIGIYLFAAGGILAMVIIVYQIFKSSNTKILYKIFENV